MPDLGDLLRGASRGPAGPVDPDGVWLGARRRRQIRVSGLAAVGVVLIAALALGVVRLWTEPGAPEIVGEPEAMDTILAGDVVESAGWLLLDEGGVPVEVCGVVLRDFRGTRGPRCLFPTAIRWPQGLPVPPGVGDGLPAAAALRGRLSGGRVTVEEVTASGLAVLGAEPILGAAEAAALPPGTSFLLSATLNHLDPGTDEQPTGTSSCNDILDSNPPQCPRGSLVVPGMDRPDLPGLQTNGQSWWISGIWLAQRTTAGLRITGAVLVDVDDTEAVEVLPDRTPFRVLAVASTTRTGIGDLTTEGREGRVVREQSGLDTAWTAAGGTGRSPLMTVGDVVLVVAVASSTCGSADDIVAVTVARGTATIVLDALGGTTQACPGPAGAGRNRVLAVAIDATAAPGLDEVTTGYDVPLVDLPLPRNDDGGVDDALFTGKLVALVDSDITGCVGLALDARGPAVIVPPPGWTVTFPSPWSDDLELRRDGVLMARTGDVLRVHGGLGNVVPEVCAGSGAEGAVHVDHPETLGLAGGPDTSPPRPSAVPVPSHGFGEAVEQAAIKGVLDGFEHSPRTGCLRLQGIDGVLVLPEGHTLHFPGDDDRFELRKDGRLVARQGDRVSMGGGGGHALPSACAEGAGGAGIEVSSPVRPF